MMDHLLGPRVFGVADRALSRTRPRPRLESLLDLIYGGSLVGPVGFEPTTSGPDLLGVTSAPGSPSINGLWYPLGGVNPLDQARRRPPLLRLNPQLFYLSVGKKIAALIALTV